jgi:hypothetical protein
VVSVKLMVEVLDHYHGPPSRKLWLVAFAEVANDHSRAGWCPRSVLAARVGVSGPRASNIASALVAEGVIKRERPGSRYHSTVYVIAELNGTVRPGRTIAGGDDDVPW